MPTLVARMQDCPRTKSAKYGSYSIRGSGFMKNLPHVWHTCIWTHIYYTENGLTLADFNSCTTTSFLSRTLLYSSFPSDPKVKVTPKVIPKVTCNIVCSVGISILHYRLLTNPSRVFLCNYHYVHFQNALSSFR